MSSDGPGVRKVRGESSAGDTPELPPLSKSLGIRNKVIPDPELCRTKEGSAVHKIVLDLRYELYTVCTYITNFI